MPWPDPVSLNGALVSVVPLDRGHTDDLAEAAADGALHRLWYTTVPAPKDVDAEIDRRLALQAAGSMLPFAILDAATGRAVGMTTYMNIDAANRHVEIGSTWYRASVQRSGFNTECKYLLLQHAFEALDCIAVEFRTHIENRQSRRAIERLGAKLDGVLRAHMIMANGTIRDSCVYSITAPEWPSVKAKLEGLMAGHAGAGSPVSDTSPREPPEHRPPEEDRQVSLTDALTLAYDHHAAGRLDEAAGIYRQILQAHPDQPDALHLLGVICHQNGDNETAIAMIQRALAERPENAKAQHNLGVVFRLVGRIDEAMACFETALSLKPDYAEAWNNLGFSYHQLGRYDEASANFDKALAIDPDFADARLNLGMQRLLDGDFAGGLPLYEARSDIERNAGKVRQFVEPKWDGAADPGGKTILLHAEQGIGDTIQFCRYAPLIAARGARVLLEVSQALHPLMASLDGVDQLIVAGDTLPPFDWHCPLPSVPWACRTDRHTIPAAVPYLSADQGHLDRWQGLLGPADVPRVGIAWAGNPEHRNDRNRSIALAEMVRLISDSYAFVSLQKQGRTADLPILTARRDILDLTGRIADFADTAALIAQLDLVVTVDTAIAHLAGALGKPVWILLPFVPDWRWGLAEETSQWYPTARLFRQSKRGDWSDVLARVADELGRGATTRFEN